MQRMPTVPGLSSMPQTSSCRDPASRNRPSLLTTGNRLTHGTRRGDAQTSGGSVPIPLQQSRNPLIAVEPEEPSNYDFENVVYNVEDHIDEFYNEQDNNEDFDTDFTDFFGDDGEHIATQYESESEDEVEKEDEQPVQHGPRVVAANAGKSTKDFIKSRRPGASLKNIEFARKLFSDTIKDLDPGMEADIDNIEEEDLPANLCLFFQVRIKYIRCSRY